MFEFAEVLLDQVSLAIDFGWDGPLRFPVALCWDMGGCAHGLDLVDQGAGVIATVGDNVPGVSQAGDQVFCRHLVGRLALAEGEPDRQASFIDDGVDLGAQSPARETDGVIFAPFFPPAACWWARMMELSMKAMDSGDCSARALKTLIHMPTFAHRLKRL